MSDFPQGHEVNNNKPRRLQTVRARIAPAFERRRLAVAGSRLRSAAISVKRKAD